ncbi:MAG: LON peptidase substrate-binding domain-containing protein [Candidatus Hydrogenedentes bacterium]|nr:LON peptidase substrate-binding domain-containing protein [Candidatus Hydrogenedentota bacterium]
MGKFLPLFPLQLVVFPGEKLKLHIFEPRYKQLIGECRDENATFGIPAYIDGRVAEFGTEMRLLTVFQTYGDGRLDILADGIAAFHLDEFIRDIPKKLYYGAHVTMLDNSPETYSVSTEELAHQYARLHEIMKTGYTRDNFTSKNVSFQIAQEVGLTLPQKIELLSIEKEANRQLMLIHHLQSVIPTLEGVQDTRRRIRENGNFKSFPPLQL